MAVKVELNQIDIFRHVPTQNCEDLGSKSVIIEKSKGEPILLEKEPVLGIYIVLEGQVAVIDSTTKNVIADLNALEAFGEMSFLQDAPASASVKVQSEEAKVALIPRKVMEQLIESDPSFGSGFFKGVAEVLVTRIRRTNSRIHDAYQMIGKIVESQNGNAEQVGHLSDAFKFLNSM